MFDKLKQIESILLKSSVTDSAIAVQALDTVERQLRSVLGTESQAEQGGWFDPCSPKVDEDPFV